VKIALQIKLNRFLRGDKKGRNESRSAKSCKACKYTLWFFISVSVLVLELKARKCASASAVFYWCLHSRDIASQRPINVIKSLVKYEKKGKNV